MDTKIVRVLRLVEYVGPVADVQLQIDKSLHGRKKFGNVQITVVTVGEPERKDETLMGPDLYDCGENWV